MKDSRYPYTYAADLIRIAVGDDYGSGLISRSAASTARSIIAEASGIDDEELAIKLADMYLSREDGS